MWVYVMEKFTLDYPYNLKGSDAIPKYVEQGHCPVVHGKHSAFQATIIKGKLYYTCPGVKGKTRLPEDKLRVNGIVNKTRNKTG